MKEDGMKYMWKVDWLKKRRLSPYEDYNWSVVAESAYQCVLDSCDNDLDKLYKLISPYFSTEGGEYVK